MKFFFISLMAGLCIVNANAAIAKTNEDPPPLNLYSNIRFYPLSFIEIQPKIRFGYEWPLKKNRQAMQVDLAYIFGEKTGEDFKRSYDLNTKGGAMRIQWHRYINQSNESQQLYLGGELYLKYAVRHLTYLHAIPPSEEKKLNLNLGLFFKVAYKYNFANGILFEVYAGAGLISIPEEKLTIENLNTEYNAYWWGLAGIDLGYNFKRKK